MAAFQHSMATINQFQFKLSHRITAFKFGLKEQNYAPFVQKLSDLWQVGGFYGYSDFLLQEAGYYDTTEILLKVALNIITLTVILQINFKTLVIFINVIYLHSSDPPFQKEKQGKKSWQWIFSI